MSEVAKTIISQIKTLDPMALFAWGTSRYPLVATKEGLRFKTSGMVKWKGFVHIKYNPGTDLYDIDFFRIREHEVKMDEQITDIYAESLVEVIDRRVG